MKERRAGASPAPTSSPSYQSRAFSWAWPSMASSGTRRITPNSRAWGRTTGSHQIQPHSWHSLGMNVRRGLIGGERGVVPFLLATLPVPCLLAIWALTRRRTPADRYLTLWLAGGLLFCLLSSYAPSRYYVLFLPPLAGLAARGLVELKRPVQAAAVAAVPADQPRLVRHSLGGTVLRGPRRGPRTCQDAAAGERRHRRLRARPLPGHAVGSNHGTAGPGERRPSGRAAGGDTRRRGAERGVLAGLVADAVSERRPALAPGRDV